MTTDNDKGQQIRQKATRLFAEHGFERVKISDITDGLGIGKGTFYLYYKNKRELLLECFKQLELLIIQFEQKEQIRDEKDFCIRMKNRMIAFEERYIATIGILNLLRNECNSSDPEISEKAKIAYDTVISPLSADIREALLKKQIREINPELGAYVILGMAESLSFRVNLDKQLKDDAIEQFYIFVKNTFLPFP